MWAVTLENLQCCQHMESLSIISHKICTGQPWSAVTYTGLHFLHLSQFKNIAHAYKTSFFFTLNQTPVTGTLCVHLTWANNNLWCQRCGLLQTDRRTDITTGLYIASFAFIGADTKKILTQIYTAIIQSTHLSVTQGLTSTSHILCCHLASPFAINTIVAPTCPHKTTIFACVTLT